jgi:hypothetical protein
VKLNRYQPIEEKEIYRCKRCNLEIERISQTYKFIARGVEDEDIVFNCRKSGFIKPSVIRITRIKYYTENILNLKPGSIHKVVKCPKQYREKYWNKIWVMGVIEPVRLFPEEYKIIGEQSYLR